MPGRQLLLSPIISTPEISQHSLHCGIKALGPSDLARTLLEHGTASLMKRAPLKRKGRGCSQPEAALLFLHPLSYTPLLSTLNWQQHSQIAGLEGWHLQTTEDRWSTCGRVVSYILQPWVHQGKNLKANIVKMAQRKGRHPPDLWWRY